MAVIYFREVQRPWAWVLLLLALTMPAVVMVLAVHRAFGHQMTSDRPLYFICGSSALLALWFSLAKLIVEVREVELYRSVSCYFGLSGSYGGTRFAKQRRLRLIRAVWACGGVRVARPTAYSAAVECGSTCGMAKLYSSGRGGLMSWRPPSQSGRWHAMRALRSGQLFCERQTNSRIGLGNVLPIADSRAGTAQRRTRADESSSPALARRDYRSARD